MDAELWLQARSLFHQGLGVPPEDRESFLEEACLHDEALRRELRVLFDSLDEAGEFMEAPAPAAVVPDPYADLEIKPYRLLKRIGRGGMGRVYLAVRDDGAYRKRVAVKLLEPGEDSEEVVRRFHDERQILAGLDHPAIARLLDGGTTPDGLPYLVMEYVEGKPIDEHCDAHRLTTRERLELFLEVCSAVRFAHQNLVVHRDLKPANILVTAAGAPKLLDFGIAKLLNPELANRRLQPTATAFRVMTPEYASPEQLRGDPVTTATDVYSLGVLLYRLLSGHPPYPVGSGSPADLMKAILEVEPTKLSEVVERHTEASQTGVTLTPVTVSATRDGEPSKLRRRLAGDVDNIVLTALAKDPRRRYGSADEFAADVRRHLDGLPVLARGQAFGYRCRKFLRRHSLACAAVLTFVLASLGFGIVMAIQRSEIARERDRVEVERQEAEVERERAEQVTAFLVDLFEVSDPFGELDGKTVTARELLERGYERLRTDLGAQPVIRAELSHTVGAIYRQLGFLDVAEPLLREALAARRARWGSAHPKVASTLAELGLLLGQRGDVEAARRLLGEALETRRRVLGEDHPEVAESLCQLAGVVQLRGEYVEAEGLYRRSLEIRRRQDVAHSADEADAMKSLALNLQNQGDYDEAERLYGQALSIERRLFGDDHPRVAVTRANLAYLLLSRGEDPGPAVELYGSSLRTLRRVLGERHDEVVNTLQALAGALAAAGDLETAEASYREALEILRDRHGRRHVAVATALNGLAGVLARAGKDAEAEEAYRDALAIYRAGLGERSPYVGKVLRGLAELLVERGDFQAAEPLLDEAITIVRDAFPGGHWQVNLMETILGECLIGLGRLDEAEPLLRAGYEVLRAKKGERWRYTEKARDLLDRLTS